MKKTLIMAVVLMFTTFTASVAQNRELKADINNTHIKPETTITVEVKVKKEKVLVGPYARYSQQLLGIMAPLNNKEIYSIESVNLKSSHNGEIIRGDKNISKHGVKSGFMNGNQLYGADYIEYKELGVDPAYSTSGGAEKSIKTMSTEAANAIFKLRRRRFDLVTGEIGEMVYGDGMKAALAEINRMEKEYMSLFIGKQKVEYAVYRYEIVPENNKNHYIICRFNNNKGILDVNDITGNPLVLTVNKLNMIEVEDMSKVMKKGDTYMKKYMIPDVAECKIMVDDKLIVTKKMNIFQFGEIRYEQPGLDFNAKK